MKRVLGGHSCHVFRTVWLRLKRNAKFDYRHDMLSYWAQAAEQPIPRLALDYEHPLIGGYEQPHRSFVFNEECVGLALEQNQLRNLIAHELGHAWHDTQPNSNIRLHGPPHIGSELEADNIASQWGYDISRGLSLVLTSRNPGGAPGSR